jgi:hypothetical protein
MKTLTVATLLSLALAAPAMAAQCAPRDQVVRLLADRYGETRQGMGATAGNAVMEVYASAATGTWTITVSDTRGITCLVASGEGYRALSEDMAQGDPA